MIGFIGVGFNGDEFEVNTDDGAMLGFDNEYVDNANMYMLLFGFLLLMQMYLFKGVGFCNVNGGDDVAIVYYEYTYGFSNRFVKDASGVGALNLVQVGAMGEVWSDWYVMDFFVD